MKQNKITQLALSALVSIWIAGSLSVTASRSLDASCSYGLVALVCASAAAFAVLAFALGCRMYKKYNQEFLYYV